jgi:hypothetical protein
MWSTIVVPSQEMTSRLARGHDYEGRPTVHMDLPVIPGAGALRSTANDLLSFLAAELGLVATPLAGAMAAQLKPRWATGREDFQFQALGWGLSTDVDGEVAWHVGRTTGFRCFLGFDRNRGVGVAVLGNQATSGGGEDIGFHVLTGRPLTPVVTRRVAEIAPEALVPCEGRYRLSPSVEIAVTVAGGRLVFRTGGRRLVFYPENATVFFMKQFDVQATFELYASGRARSLVLRENGRHRCAPRLDD